MGQDKTVYTVGYAGFHSPEDLLAALKSRGVSVLIDVRSVPRSSYFTDYNIENLSPFLRSHGIIYRNYDREFGARQTDRSFYKNGRLDFRTFRSSRQFAAGVEKVSAALDTGRIPALMCAEKDPIGCHRAIMVGKGLRDRGFQVIHLLPDGSGETQEELEARLLEVYFPDRSQMSLFGNSDDGELIKDAYDLANDAIGFREDEL